MSNRLYDESEHDPELRDLIARAKKGDSKAIWALWKHYHNQQDYLQALPLLKRLAERGIASALLNLGYYHENGLGTRVDYYTAMDLYGRAADKGDTTAMINLGKLYARYTDSPPHQHKARALFVKAAELGDPEAMYCLGEQLYQGPAAPQDKAEAVKWLERAADKGFVSAIWRLLFHYRDAYFEPRDPGGAIRCLRRLADKGYPDQQHACAVSLFRGGDGEVDIAEAYYWLLLAVRHGFDEGAPDLRICGKFLPRAQRKMIAAQADAWQKKNAGLKQSLRDWAETHRKELAEKRAQGRYPPPILKFGAPWGLDKWLRLLRKLREEGIRVPRYGLFVHRRGEKPKYVKFPEE